MITFILIYVGIGLLFSAVYFVYEIHNMKTKVYPPITINLKKLRWRGILFMILAYPCLLGWWITEYVYRKI